MRYSSSTINGAGEATVDDTTARNAAASAADRASEAANNLADTARDALNSTMKRARRAVESASDWAADTASDVSDVSVRGYRSAEDVIRVQPVLAVSAALIIGVALGVLLFSSRRD
jgi:ElaB/YqjD/DUF883 family membrane-anchored ribosome-binding protein